MKKFLLRVSLIYFAVMVLLPLNVQAAKTIIGRIEKVTLPGNNITMNARIDTGAHTCSIHIDDYNVVTVGTERFVEFSTEDQQGKKYHVRAKIFKESKVKSTSGDMEARFVIREELQLGTVKKIVNINLNDRSNLKYNFLVGRNFLRGDFLVDVSQSHVLGE